MNIIEQIQERLDPNTISQLSQQIGAESNDQTEAAVSGVISTLLAGLSRNAQQPGGTDALVSAIDRDHDGSLLDDLAGFLFKGRQTQNPKTTNGSGILEHILGNNQARSTDMLSKVSGLKTSQIIKLMIMLAPVVLSALGKARHAQGLDTNGIGDLLRQSTQGQANHQQRMGLLQRFLDKNGDGNVMDDITRMGSTLFRNR